MKEVRLKRGQIALVDDADYALVSAYSWFLHSEGYAVATVTEADRKYSLLMHRLIIGTEKGQQTDHKDRNRLNNQRYNLRTADQCQNQGNAWWNKTGKTSKFKGVCWRSQDARWEAQLKVTVIGRKRTLHLGLFASETEAALAYNAAANKHFGKFALLNTL